MAILAMQVVPINNPTSEAIGIAHGLGLRYVNGMLNRTGVGLPDGTVIHFMEESGYLRVVVIGAKTAGWKRCPDGPQVMDYPIVAFDEETKKVHLFAPTHFDVEWGPSYPTGELVISYQYSMSNTNYRWGINFNVKRYPNDPNSEVQLTLTRHHVTSEVTEYGEWSFANEQLSFGYKRTQSYNFDGYVTTGMGWVSQNFDVGTLDIPEDEYSSESVTGTNYYTIQGDWVYFYHYENGSGGMFHSSAIGSDVLHGDAWEYRSTVGSMDKGTWVKTQTALTYEEYFEYVENTFGSLNFSTQTSAGLNETYGNTWDQSELIISKNTELSYPDKKRNYNQNIPALFMGGWTEYESKTVAFAWGEVKNNTASGAARYARELWVYEEPYTGPPVE